MLPEKEQTKHSPFAPVHVLFFLHEFLLMRTLFCLFGLCACFLIFGCTEEDI